VTTAPGPAPAPALPTEAAEVGLGPLRPRRPWSTRRNASALTALVLTGAGGALLYEEVYIHTGHTAHRWRTWITDALVDHSLNNHWVIAGSAVACVLGLWLLLLALTPGRRSVLPMTGAGTSGVRAVLERSAAVALLHRATLEVNGVKGAKVKVGRRRALIRAVVGFGAHEQAAEELTRHLSAERDRMGVVRPPTVKVKVRSSKS
jgi:hypothetical protein